MRVAPAQSHLLLLTCSFLITAVPKPRRSADGGSYMLIMLIMLHEARQQESEATREIKRIRVCGCEGVRVRLNHHLLRVRSFLQELPLSESSYDGSQRFPEELKLGHG